MSDTPLNGQQEIRLTPEQMAAMLVIEGLLQAIQVGVNQLGGFIKYTPAAEILANAGAVLGRDYMAMRKQWERSVVVAPASALSVIEGKKTH